MGIIKTLDMKIAIKLRGIYDKFFNPSQPQFTINCEKDKNVIQKMIYERIVGGATSDGSSYGTNRNRCLRECKIHILQVSKQLEVYILERTA